MNNYRLVAVNLIDAHYCTDAGKYISVLLLSLKTMIQLELPHINVLSKVDLIESYGKLAFNLEYYTEVFDLSYLLETLNTSPITSRYSSLNAALCSLIEDFGLVSFETLCIEEKNSVAHLLTVIDKANGYIFGGLTKGNENIMDVAVNVGLAPKWDVRDVEERWIGKGGVWDDNDEEVREDVDGK